MTARKRKWPWRFVEVVWEDTHSDSKWRSAGEDMGTVLVHSRGWLIFDDKKMVRVAGSVINMVGEDGDYTVGDVTAIPRRCIDCIRDLKV